MIRLTAPVLAASLLVLGPWATPAAADCGLGSTGSGCGTEETVSSGTGYYTIPGTSCGAWVSTGSWGGACAAPGYYGGDVGPIPTWRQIIHGGSFDPCRLDELAPGFAQPRPPVDAEERAEGDEWLIRTCMTGFDLDTIDGGPGIKLDMKRVWDDYESYDPPPWLDEIWGDVSASQSTLPYAMIDYGPNPYPVVNSPIFFNVDFQRFTADGPVSLGSGGRVELPIGTDAGSGQTIYLVARSVGVTVDPGGQAQGLARCNNPEDRANRFQVGKDTIEEFARTTRCKWTYKHSSASEDDDAYDAVARSRWEVRYRVGESGPLTLLNDAVRTVVQTKMSYQIPVQEVQVRDCVVAEICADD